MTIMQISVFLENKQGRLAQVTNILSKNNIDISAISVADTANFGIIRLIVNKPEDAIRVIKDAGFTINTTEVLAIEVSDSPGGLHEALDVLNQNNIGIEYLYSFVRRPTEKALILFRVKEIEKAIENLKNKGVNILSPSEIYDL